jgi:hypothetical protein
MFIAKAGWAAFFKTVWKETFDEVRTLRDDARKPANEAESKTCINKSIRQEKIRLTNKQKEIQEFWEWFKGLSNVYLKQPAQSFIDELAFRISEIDRLITVEVSNPSSEQTRELIVISCSGGSGGTLPSRVGDGLVKRVDGFTGNV